MFKKLRNEMLIMNMLIISILMIIVFGTIYGIIYSNLQAQYQEELAKVRLINLDSIKNINKFEDQGFRDEIGKIDTSFNILLDENNEVTRISSYLDIEEVEYDEIIKNIVEIGENEGTIIIDDREWRYSKNEIHSGIIKSGVFGDSYYEISFIDITNSEETLSMLLFILIIVGIITLIIIFFISLYFSNKAIKPVEKIWLKQKQFIADATHELKTPLTIINANIDAITVNEESKVKEHKKWIKYIKNETKGMNKLINELLHTAKSEEEKYDFKNENISNMISDVILSVETIIFEKDIKLELDIEKDIRIETDIEKLRQVIIILVDNAIKYTNREGKINIKLCKKNKNVIFEIENSGEGIDEKHIPYIFDRFYKCDESRTDNSYGLGLFIAKTIIDKLKGTIEVQSKKNEITRFKIKIK